MKDLLKRVNVYYLKEAYVSLEKQAYGHLDIQQRLLRALRILTEDTNYSINIIKNTPMTLSVVSPNGVYTVIPSQQSCTCPDSEKQCKHRLAVKLISEAIKLERKDI